MTEDRIDRAIGKTPVAGFICRMSSEVIASIAYEARRGKRKQVPRLMRLR